MVAFRSSRARYSAENMWSQPMQRTTLPEKQRTMLLKIATGTSEQFARKIMQSAIVMDSGEDSTTAGVDFVESLNGIDVYEEELQPLGSPTSSPRGPPSSGVSTRVRAVCHIEAKISEFIRHMATSTADELLPGIVETREVYSVVKDSTRDKKKDALFVERAGINWCVLNEKSARDSVSSSCTTARESDPSECGDPTQEKQFDFVLLSYQDVFTHRERRGWLQWCQSIDLPSFGALSDPQTKRCTLLPSGIVAVESATRPGQISVSYVMGVDLQDCDASERRLLDAIVWKRVMKLAGLKKTLERASLARTLSLSTTNDESGLIPEDEPSQEANKDSKPSQKKAAPTPLKRQGKSARCLSMDACLPSQRKLDTSARREKKLRAYTMNSSTLDLLNGTASPEDLLRDPSLLEFRLSLYEDPTNVRGPGEAEGPSSDGDHTTEDRRVRVDSKNMTGWL
ncbi:hypothetical protein Poli38472_007767 [Pythium oligandrum]|uniref:START domain-containing protein n=1 Tax=Pythium oligandrum TaxID=41045 RepID=A0A8K1CRA4_PYTOL|nr:hypothetical protein Poli38472_007767 [Pythium oligandrum]|eukprot:TMW68095.1 hypothetical protein Poli38472_007767 [Pythium oligandrum]